MAIFNVLSLFRLVYVAFVLSNFFCVSSERPRWIDGKAVIGEVESGSYWSSLVGGAKSALRNIFSPGDIEALDEKIEPNNIDEPPVMSKLSGKESDDLISEANRFMVAGETDRAIDTLFLVLDSDPHRIDANIAVGFLLMNIQKPELAENFLYTAVRMSNWTNAGAVANLAECLRQNNDSELGEKVAMKGLNALGNNDETGMIAQSLGVINVERKDYATAADWFLASALMKPLIPESWLKASTMLFPAEGRDLKFAENVLLQGIESNPDDAQLLYQLGVVMHRTDHIDQAIVLYEAALGNDGTMQKVKSTLATAYHAVRRFDEAVVLYEEAVAFEPSNVILLSNYAILLCVELGRVNEGLLLVQNAKEINPYSNDVSKAEADCTAAEDRPSETNTIPVEL